MIDDNKWIYALLWWIIIAKYFDALSTIIGVKHFALKEFNPLGFNGVIIGSAIIMLLFYILTVYVKNSDRIFIKETHKPYIIFVLDLYIIIMFTITLSNLMHVTLIILGYTL